MPGIAQAPEIVPERGIEAEPVIAEAQEVEAGRGAWALLAAAQVRVRVQAVAGADPAWVVTAARAVDGAGLAAGLVEAAADLAEAVAEVGEGDDDHETDITLTSNIS